MARKGKKVVHKYKLRHLDKWKKLQAQEERPEPKVNPNVNQLWDWNTLEDVKVK